MESGSARRAHPDFAHTYSEHKVFAQLRSVHGRCRQVYAAHGVVVPVGSEHAHSDSEMGLGVEAKSAQGSTGRNAGFPLPGS